MNNIRIAKQLIKIAKQMIADYEVIPNDGHKSFYGKAIVKKDEKGYEVLYSYGTAVLRKEGDNIYRRLWGDWSATTGRHIMSWAGINKRQWDNTPVGGIVDKQSF